MSLSNSPSTSQAQSPQSSPNIPATCSPNLVKRMQQDKCYKCLQRGHWSYYCPFKSPKVTPISPSPSGKNNCAYPIKRADGSCGDHVCEDELVCNNSKNIVPVKQSRQRTLDEFWEGSQNDKTDHELSKGDGLQVQNKRMKITNCFEDLDIGEGSGAALNGANLKHDGFPKLECSNDDIEFINSVSWDTVEAEASLSLSRLSTPSRIRQRQRMFQKHIFFDSLCEKDESMENSHNMEEQSKLLEEEKRFTKLQDDCVKTEALLESSNQDRQLLCEEVSNLETMLNEKQNKLKSCELEISKIETHLTDLKRSMFKTNITLKERAKQIKKW